MLKQKTKKTTFVTIEFEGKILAIEGSYYKGDPGTDYAPPSPPGFEIDKVTDITDESAEEVITGTLTSGDYEQIEELCLEKLKP